MWKKQKISNALDQEHWMGTIPSIKKWWWEWDDDGIVQAITYYTTIINFKVNVISYSIVFSWFIDLLPKRQISILSQFYNNIILRYIYHLKLLYHGVCVSSHPIKTTERYNNQYLNTKWTVLPDASSAKTKNKKENIPRQALA